MKQQSRRRTLKVRFIERVEDEKRTAELADFATRTLNVTAWRPSIIDDIRVSIISIEMTTSGSGNGLCSSDLLSYVQRNQCASHPLDCTLHRNAVYVCGSPSLQSKPSLPHLLNFSWNSFGRSTLGIMTVFKALGAFFGAALLSPRG